MLHTNIKCLSPSFSLNTLPALLPLTIKLLLLFLDLVSFKVFFCQASSRYRLATWVRASFWERTCMLSWYCGACLHVCFQEDHFPICRHHVPFDRSCDWPLETYLAMVIFKRRVTGKEWRSTDCLAALSYFSNLKKMNGGEWKGWRRRGSEKVIEKVKEGRQ